MAEIIQISHESVIQILNWKDTITAVQSAMLSVTEKRAFQIPRSVTYIPNTDNTLFTMPGYLNHKEFGALACKLVTLFPKNPSKSLPSVLGNILLFHEETGALKAIIDGTEITLWRTAASSLLATKFIRGPYLTTNILAIVGAGEQGRIHAIAFQDTFQFNKIHIWNRNYEKAEKLCCELNGTDKRQNKNCIPFKLLKECVKEADVVITTTNSTIPLIQDEWLKSGVHINAVGAGGDVMELDEKTYKSSAVYVDHLDGIDHELKHLTDRGITFKGEIGGLINGTLPPISKGNSIFQSLGMAVEDCAMAKMVYDKYMKSQT